VIPRFQVEEMRAEIRAAMESIAKEILAEIM
jgi:hypothetical protein